MISYRRLSAVDSDQWISWRSQKWPQSYTISSLQQATTNNKKQNGITTNDQSKKEESSNSTRSYLVPLVYSRIADNLYRSAYQNSKTYSFIESLHLHSMLSLIEIKNDLRIFLTEQNIRLYECNIGINQEPFLSMSEQAVNDANNIIRIIRYWSLYKW